MDAMTRLAAICPLICLIAIPVARAQQVATDPTSTHIFPGGARRGTTTKVRMGGECLPPRTRFLMEGDGVKFPDRLGPRAAPRGEPSLRRKPDELHINYPKEWEAEFEIAADAPLGPRLWWLACARGGTGGRPFIIGDLPEFIETEPNSLPARAERIELPVTVNGQIDGERDMDYFRFEATEGSVVVADVVAARIGSPLEAVVQFLEPSGRRLSVQEVRVGGDSVLALRAPVTGEYLLAIANLSTPGGPQFVYRVTLSTSPYSRLAYPDSGRPGESQELELLQLTGTARFSAGLGKVAFPATPGGFRWSPAGASSPLVLEATTLPSQLEREPNDAREVAHNAVVPFVLNGRFESRTDEDWVRFEAKAGEPLSIECVPAGVGLPILPIISVHDAAGGVLARASAIETPDRRPTIETWTPPADGTYFLCVRDVQQGVASGLDFVYRVTARPARPDFELTAKTDWANHVQGGRTEIDLQVRRRGGFAGPVKVVVDGLPPGVRTEPLELAAGAPAGKLVLVSDATTEPCDSLVRIAGLAEINGVAVSRVATAVHLGCDADGVSIGSPTTDQFHLTVVRKPLFRLFCSEAYQYAHRGTVHHYQMQVERFDGFDGPITLQIADRQNKDLDGIEVHEVTIPSGASTIMLPVFLPETMHINVQAHSNVYAQGIALFQDGRGHEQSTCVVSEMRCMIRTLPTVTRLSAAEPEVPMTSAGRARVRLRVERTSLFSGPLTVALQSVVPPCGITAEPTTIAAGETETQIELQAPVGQSLPPSVELRFRATGRLEDDMTIVIADTAVRVRPDAGR